MGNTHFSPSLSLSLSVYQLLSIALPAQFPSYTHIFLISPSLSSPPSLPLLSPASAGEDSEYSKPVSVDLNNLFTNLVPTQVTEMTLTANRPASQLHRYVLGVREGGCVFECVVCMSQNKGNFLCSEFTLALFRLNWKTADDETVRKVMFWTTFSIRSPSHSRSR